MCDIYLDIHRRVKRVQFMEHRMKRQVGILCPTCGRNRMERVSREITTRVGRRAITVSDVEVDECPKCGERLYDLAALRRIRQARGTRAA
jgi:YgiT-type zinc finger domain-containing protein